MSKLNSSSISAFVRSGVSVMLLRVFSAGFLFYLHGYGKVVSVINGQFQFADPIGIGPEASLILAAFAEGICTLLIIAGFYTRLAALFLMINFVVAYYAAFKEPALLYLLVFTVIFLMGPGKWAVDSKS